MGSPRAAEAIVVSHLADMEGARPSVCLVADMVCCLNIVTPPSATRKLTEDSVLPVGQSELGG